MRHFVSLPLMVEVKYYVRYAQKMEMRIARMDEIRTDEYQVHLYMTMKCQT